MVTRRGGAVVGLIGQPQSVGILGRIASQNRFGAIGRAIVNADYLEIGKSLREDAIHGRGNGRGRVVGGNDYRNAAHRLVRARSDLADLVADLIGRMRQRLGKFEDRAPQRGRLSNRDDNDYAVAD